MTPLQAVQYLDSIFPNGNRSYISKHTLLERLRGGMVRAAARKSVRSNQQAPDEFSELDHDEWVHVGEDYIFWSTGDLTYEVSDEWSRKRIQVRQFDVRFEPDAVRDIVANAAKAAREKPTTTTDVPVDEIQKGPPVSDAHLSAWFEVYQQAYPGGTEMHALESARGMFPGKSVSRDRIRDLRGAQKRGPKGPRNFKASPRK